MQCVVNKAYLFKSILSCGFWLGNPVSPFIFTLHYNKKKKFSSICCNNFPFTVKAAAMGSVYSRLSNGEINQRYVGGPPTEKIPLRPMDPDLPISSMPPPCPTMTMDDPYTQGLPNYATFRGKPNGLGLKVCHHYYPLTKTKYDTTTPAQQINQSRSKLHLKQQ